MAKNNYGADAIGTLSPRDAVRMRAGMYIGNTNFTGYHHPFYEIFSNSIDEAINGYGDTIIIRLIDKNTIEIEDFGRGIPFGKNKEGVEVLEMNFTTLHAGGKLDNTKDNASYSSSGGTNGVGVAITNFLSTELTVTSIRENETATLHFVNGVSEKGTQIVKRKSDRTGTIIRFTPDLSIFKTVKGFSVDYILGRIEDQVNLEKIKVIFEDKLTGETKTFLNNEGIGRFITNFNNTEIEEDGEDAFEEDKKTSKVVPITSKIVGENIIGETVVDKQTRKIEINFALEFITENKKIVKGYTNSIFNPEGGKHVLGFNNGIIKGIKNILKYQGQNGENIIKEMMPEDLLSNIIGIISIKIPDPEFQSQTKNKLTNNYVVSVIEDEVSKVIEKNFTQKDIDNVIKSITDRINFRKKLKKEELKLKAAVNEKDLQSKLPTKLTDALSKNRKETEMFIVEGDSAAGGLKKERNPQIHAIMPLRGKMLNVLKANNEKSGNNQEVNNMIYAISGGRLYDELDVDKHLRYGKIIILTDADSDGAHIEILIIGFFVKYYFELIEKGYLYIGNPPLYSASKKEDVKYFYSDKEKDEFLNTKEGKTYHISRFKGLGEMNPSELSKAAFGARTRSLHKVTIEDAEEAKRYITEFMVQAGAKGNLIKNYQEEYLEKIENDEMGLNEKTKEIVEVVKDNAMVYSLEVNQDRSIPYIEDGLKNVNRRTIYSLVHGLNSKSNGDYLKSATITGHVIGYYHPHGDSSVYEAMVMMIQDFRQNHQYVTGHGSFGSIFAPEGFGASRYTKAKISKFAEDTLIENLHKKPVPFMPNYANTLEEPIVLPAKLPTVLLSSDSGIGYGMAHRSISHNIREVLDATIAYLTKGKNDIYKASDYIKGPDLPQGGYILNTPEEIREIYANPKGGTFTFRVLIEQGEYNKKKGLIIPNVPATSYNTENLIDKLKSLLLENQLYGIKSITDISGDEKGTGEKGFKVFLETQDKVDIKMVLENLYKKVVYNKSGLEYSIRYYPLYVNRNKELKLYSLNDIISTFVDFRRETVRNILTYDINKLLGEIKNIENKILFALNIDKIVKIIKSFDSRSEIKKEIIKAFPKYNLTEEDAEIIIETKLINIKDLSTLEKNLEAKKKELNKLQEILGSDKKLDNMIVKELEELREIYKRANRKTKFLTIKDLNAIKEVKEQYNNMQKGMKEEEKKKPNYIYIDDLGFLFRDFAANMSTVQTRLDKFKENNKTKPILENLNENTGTLYVLSNNNLGYFIHLDKMPLKQDRVSINRLIKGFSGEVIYAFIYNKEKSSENNISIIYKDKDGNIGGMRINTDNIAKSRQGFNLFGNDNELLAVYDGKETEIDLASIKKLDLSKYGKIKKTIFQIEDLPLKKSLSSGKTLIKRKN